MTSSNGNIIRVTGHLYGEFTGHRWIHRKRSVTRRFDVFFDLLLNKRLGKQWWGWWFETPSWSLWRHGNVCTQFALHCVLSQFGVVLIHILQGHSIHYNDVIMSTIASQITILTIVYSIVHWSTDQSSALLAFVRGIHRRRGNVSIWWRHHVTSYPEGYNLLHHTKSM